ncbi:hypothetical protein AAKU55_003736 [Oxalobacteraceae bacterium GrIS 1.11]
MGSYFSAAGKMAAQAHAIALIGLMLSSAPGRAVDSARPISAPVACDDAPSCGSDIGPAQAQASYAGHGRRSLPATGRSASAMTERNLCDAVPLPGTAGDYFWAPAHELIGGEAALRQLLLRAASGAATGGHVIVETDTSTALERHLALCSVATVAGVTGPPRNCATVALIMPQQVWLRGGNPRQAVCVRSASFRNSGAIDLHYTVLSGADPRKVGTALLRAIEQGFGLSAEQEISNNNKGELDAIYIRATGALGDSRILGGGWREAIDFDGFILPKGERQLSVRGTVHALVCRQALGNIINYNGPSDAQRAAYASAFDAGIATAIRASGANCKKQDATTIECE